MYYVKICSHWLFHCLHIHQSLGKKWELPRVLLYRHFVLLALLVLEPDLDQTDENPQ